MCIRDSINIVMRTEATWTGGPDGMPVPPLSLAGFEISGDKHWYWIAAVLLSVSVWASLNMIDSPFGRALRALHGSEAVSYTHLDVYKRQASR